MRIYLKLFSMALVWGGTFIAGRLVAGSLGPYAASFLRYALASVVLVWYLRRTEGPLGLPPRGTGLPVVVLGLTGIFTYNVCFFKSLGLINAGRAAVIVATNPIFIALLAAALFDEHLTKAMGAGVLLSVTGAVVVVTRGDVASLVLGGAIGWGELFVCGSVASWVVFSLVGKVVVGRLSPLRSITYASVVGTVALAGPALADGLVTALVTTPLHVWACVAYLAIFGTVLGFLWYYEGIATIGPSRTALFINFVPVSAVALGFLVLGEPVTPSLLAGTAMVTAGVYLTDRARRSSAHN